MMPELSSTRWPDAHRNVLIIGHTGIGKSYLSCALGNFAAQTGYTVLYLRAPRLFETLHQARGDGSHLKTLTRLAKVQLLIIGDPTLADAVCDRLMHNAYRIELRGDSLRRQQNQTA